MKKLIGLLIMLLPTMLVAAPVCPEVNLIKKTPFNQVQKGDHQDIWTFTQNHQKYKTPYQWEFSIMVEAGNHRDAFKKANLSQLKKTKGPEKIDDVWVCDYKSKTSLSAIAKTKAL